MAQASQQKKAEDAETQKGAPTPTQPTPPAKTEEPTTGDVPPSAQTGDEEMNSDLRDATPVASGQAFNPVHNEPEGDPEGVVKVPVIHPAVFNEVTDEGYVNVAPEYQRFRGPEAASNPDVTDRD